MIRALVLPLALAATMPAAAIAATDDAPNAGPSIAPNTAPSATAVPAGPRASIDPPEVIALGRELRCPVCQGMPVGESPSDTAQAMMQRIRELYAEGQSPEAIRDYFVARYGEWVLLEPKGEGFDILVWVLPPLALVLGLVLLVLCTRKGRGEAAGTAGPIKPSSGSAAPDSEYVRRVREALARGDT